VQTAGVHLHAFSYRRATPNHSSAISRLLALFAPFLLSSAVFPTVLCATVSLPCASGGACLRAGREHARSMTAAKAAVRNGAWRRWAGGSEPAFRKASWDACLPPLPALPYPCLCYTTLPSTLPLPFAYTLPFLPFYCTHFGRTGLQPHSHPAYCCPPTLHYYPRAAVSLRCLYSTLTAAAGRGGLPLRLRLLLCSAYFRFSHLTLSVPAGRALPCCGRRAGGSSLLLAERLLRGCFACCKRRGGKPQCFMERRKGRILQAARLEPVMHFSSPRLRAGSRRAAVACVGVCWPCGGGRFVEPAGLGIPKAVCLALVKCAAGGAFSLPSLHAAVPVSPRFMRSSAKTRAYIYRCAGISVLTAAARRKAIPHLVNLPLRRCADAATCCLHILPHAISSSACNCWRYGRPHAAVLPLYFTLPDIAGARLLRRGCCCLRKHVDCRALRFCRLRV